MKKPLKVILIILLVLVILAILLFVAAGIIVNISEKHRSDPSMVVQYETENPFITGETQISAHRSGAGIAPEQTMMALRYCAENEDFAVDVFEFDLHITQDDQLVLLHDDTLDRTTDSLAVYGEADVRPENKTLAELKQLNMGAKFVAADGSMPFAQLTEVPGELRIVTVEEALDYLSSVDDYNYIIEVKNTGDLGFRAVDLLYGVLAERNMVDKVAFGSFDVDIGRYASEKYPDMARGTSEVEVAQFYLAALFNKKDYEPPCTVLQLPFCPEYLEMGINFGTATVMNYAHRHDLALQYWTVNDPVDMEYLVRMGADCIMTDYPDVLYDVIQKVKAEEANA